MMQLPLTDILDWANPENFNLDGYSDDGPTSCFLGVDLDSTNKLHDLHNDYRLPDEKNKRQRNALRKNEKLIPNIGNKRKYKPHYENLKHYLELGLLLKKFVDYSAFSIPKTIY